MKIKGNGWLFAQQKSTNFQSIWVKEKLPIKASDLKNLQVTPSYFQKRTKTFKRLVKRFYYIANNTLYYCEKQKSTQIKGMLELSMVYAEFYESKVKILKNNTYIICLRQDASFVELLTENKQIFNEWSAVFRKCCIMLDFHHQFNILKMIGKGGFSRVFLAQDKYSRENYAIKVITKDKLLQQSKGIKSLLNEIQIMKDLYDINGCLKLMGVYETDSSVNLVLEYVKGGELVKRIKLKDKNNFTIENARQLMQNILIALVHIHQRKIIHRDLKPDNILLEESYTSNKIKIADFGLATYDSSVLTDFLFKKCGTPGFLAPEVLSNKEPYKLYDQKVDVFSAGVIFYILLCGQQPFKGINHKQVVEQNKLCDIDFAVLDLNSKIPQAAKILLKQMLTRDPLSRPTSQECLNSIFFKENYQNNNLNLDINGYEKLKLQSLDGLNKMKLTSLERASHNDLYWINPIWKGQTSTLQTVTKLSSIYLQMNEVRKRNKSNFAPTQNQQGEIENEGSPLMDQVREKRSASADCDFRNKFFNQSLHIAVLKKRQGEDQTNSNNAQVSIDNNFIVIEEDQQSDRTSTHENHKSGTIPKTSENSPPQFQFSMQNNAQIPLFFDGSLKASIFKRQFNPTLEMPTEEHKVSFKSSGGDSIENEPHINQLRKVQPFQNENKIKTVSNINCQHLPKDQQLSSRDYYADFPSADERVQYEEESRNKQYSNRSVEYNLKKSEALENHCQKVNHISIRLRNSNCFKVKENISFQPSTNNTIINNGSFQNNSIYINNNNNNNTNNNYNYNQNINNSNSNNQENIEESVTFLRQSKRSNSNICNSCQEADFRVSEVEENISSRHQAINRNLIFRYNPFDQDVQI